MSSVKFERSQNRMCILVIGNIGAGKSHLIKQILKEWNYFSVIAIDEFRKEVGDNTFSSEYFAWYNLFKTIENEKQFVLEFTGAGPHKYAIRETLISSNSKTIVIYLATKSEICRKRNSNRFWDTPYPWRIKPNDIIEKIGNELFQDWTSNFWGSFIRFRSDHIPDIISFLRREIHD